jgi:hypothetical protein
METQKVRTVIRGNIRIQMYLEPRRNSYPRTSKGPLVESSEYRSVDFYEKKSQLQRLWFDQYLRGS